MSQSEHSSTPGDESPELPEFNLENVLNDIWTGIKAILFDPELKSAVLPALFIFELIATKIIRLAIPYTEIDYTAYVEQIEIIKSGELNYANIYGGTGPLVYPAGHVWIYKAMYWVTNGKGSISSGQELFGYLYLFSQALTFLIYANLNLQPWALYSLVLSKRLHSIYILRLFNDCFTTFFILWTTLSLVYASKWKKSSPKLSKYITNLIAPFNFGLAISVKMNALLYLPGFLVVTYFMNDEILLAEVVPIAVILLVQIGSGYQFLYNGPEIRNAYFAGAFNFQRKFLYKWTVNWKFLSEEVFLSDEFHNLLLVIHGLLLVVFLFTKWTGSKITGKSTGSLIIDGLKIFKPTLSANHIINNPRLGPTYVVGTLVSSNLIGVLVARSLHYQFLSWYAWSLPFLLYGSGLHFIVGIALGLVHEVCWNIYPSTSLSSGVLVAVNSILLIGYWLNNSLYSLPEPTKEDKDK
jgi:alpha-1,3-mannosyltransferase